MKASRLLLGLLLGAGLAIASVHLGCAGCENEMRTKVGAFGSPDAGMRSSIKKLATDIRRCPNAKRYRVIWESPMLEGDLKSQDQAILYDREHKRLGYEHDIGSGISGRAYIVGDEEIEIVAEKGGTLEDFAEYSAPVR